MPHTIQCEVKIDFDSDLRPISAQCVRCREKMPSPPNDLKGSPEVIAWLSDKFIEHRTARHSEEERRRVPRD